MFSLLQCSKVLLPLIAATAMSLCDAAPIAAFGLPHTPLGNAQVDVQNGNVVVSNIGTGGGDGVLVGLPADTALFHADFGGIGPAGAYAPGSYFQVAGRGTLDGVADQVVSTARATARGADEWELAFDFSPVAPGPITAQYVVGGEVIYEETIFAGLLVWLTNHTFLDAEISGCVRSVDGCTRVKVDLGFSWGTGTRVRSLRTGVEFTIDQLLLQTAPTGISFDGYSGAEITASGIPSFTITNEELTRAIPEPSTLALTLLALLALAMSRCMRDGAMSRWPRLATSLRSHPPTIIASPGPLSFA